MYIIKVVAFTLGTIFSCFTIGAETLVICLSNSIHPYVLPNEQSGLNADLISNALNNSALANRKQRFVYYPNSRIKQGFNYGECDIATQAKEDSTWKNAYFTNYPIITFNNKIITLKSKNIHIERIKDLHDFRVLAWHGAHKYLGDEYEDMTQNNTNYFEKSSKLPSDMLILERVDIVISESNVFRYNLHKFSQANKEIKYQDLFPSNNEYKWAFSSLSLKQNFESGLKELYKNNQIDDIFKHYVKKYNVDRRAYKTMDCHYGNINKACN
jgi:ABC-type amino acid transport substrate-binding protein